MLELNNLTHCIHFNLLVGATQIPMHVWPNENLPTSLKANNMHIPPEGGNTSIKWYHCQWHDHEWHGPLPRSYLLVPIWFSCLVVFFKSQNWNGQSTTSTCSICSRRVKQSHPASTCTCAFNTMLSSHCMHHVEMSAKPDLENHKMNKIYVSFCLNDERW